MLACLPGWWQPWRECEGSSSHPIFHSQHADPDSPGLNIAPWLQVVVGNSLPSWVDFCDFSLACTGRRISAHRIIISSPCSWYLKNATEKQKRLKLVCHKLHLNDLGLFLVQCRFLIMFSYSILLEIWRFIFFWLYWRRSSWETYYSFHWWPLTFLYLTCLIVTS